MNFAACLSALGFLMLPLLGSRVLAAEINVPTPSAYSYEDDKVYQLQVRGTYGRYITFVGRTLNEYAGKPSYYNPGSQGKLNCTTNLYGSTNCYRSGYIAPTYTAGTPGGFQHSQFRYELDCQDMTFDRKGDLLTGFSLKGWMDVSVDPTASAVAARFCPQIANLPRVYSEGGRYILESSDDNRKTRLVALAMAKSHCFQEEQGMDSQKAFEITVNALITSGIQIEETVRLIDQDSSYAKELTRFKAALDKKTCRLNEARLIRSF